MTKYQALKKRINKIEQRPESQEAMIKRVMDLKIFGGESFNDICNDESMKELWGDEPG